MYFEEEIKLEDFSSSNSLLCFACLSSTRKLSSLSEYCAIFDKFFDYECSPDLRPISLCWECTAVLRKVKLFKEKVDHAQTVLSYHYLSQVTPPSCLSSLNTTEVEISTLGTKLEQEVDNTNALDTHEEIQTYRNSRKKYKNDDLEIKEELDTDTDQADDMFMLGWADDDIDEDTNTDNDAATNKEKNIVSGEPNVKDDSVKCKAKDITKTKAQNVKNSRKKYKKSNEKNNKTNLKTEKQDSELTNVSVLLAKKLSKVMPDRAIINSFSQICVEKKLRKSAKYALKTVKAVLNPDPEIDDDNEQKKSEPESLDRNLKGKKRKTTENSDSDPDFKDSHFRKYIKSGTQEKKPLYQYLPRNRERHVSILDTPVALDEVRWWMDKDKETEVWKNLKYKCEMCVRSVAVTSKIAHPKNHKKTTTRIYFCDICTLGFFDEGKKDRHVVKHHTKLLQCSACGYKCYLMELMEKHVKTHRNRIQCLACMGLFPTHVAFYEHYCICDYCQRSHKDKRKLEWHIFRKHTIPSCKPCNIIFGDYTKYKRHLSIKHPSTKSGQQQPEDFYCVSCDKHFAQEKLLQQHLDKSMAHAAERPPKPEDSVPKPKPPRVPCLACPRTFAGRFKMVNHYNFVHLKKYNYKCDQCDKVCLNGSLLKKHILVVHEGVKPPKNKFCPHCHQAFADSHVLINHIRTHTGERPYQCEHCDARFAQRVAWKQHVKFVHLKERRAKPNVEPEPSNYDPMLPQFM